MRRKELTGVTAMSITPLKANHELDEEGLREHVRFLIDSGISGIAPCGDTGESVFLTFEERKKIFSIVADEISEKIAFVPNAIDFWQDRSVQLTRHAKDLGADAVMVEMVAYLPTNERQVYDFHAAHAKVDVPIALHNSPPVTHVDLDARVVAKLSKDFDNITYIKEASGVLQRVPDIIRLTEGRVKVLIGADSLCYHGMALGAFGWASAYANIMPKESVELYRLIVEQGDLKKAEKLYRKILPLLDIWQYNARMFKFLLDESGRKGGPVRRPWGEPLTDSEKNEIRAAKRKTRIEL
jgi:4-hydroxy-tetrahydrodipicolinate synthase